MRYQFPPGKYCHGAYPPQIRRHSSPSERNRLFAKSAALMIVCPSASRTSGNTADSSPLARQVISTIASRRIAGNVTAPLPVTRRKLPMPRCCRMFPCASAIKRQFIGINVKFSTSIGTSVWSFQSTRFRRISPVSDAVSVNGVFAAASHAHIIAGRLFSHTSQRCGAWKRLNATT